MYEKNLTKIVLPTVWWSQLDGVNSIADALTKVVTNNKKIDCMFCLLYTCYNTYHAIQEFVIQFEVASSPLRSTK